MKIQEDSDKSSPKPHAILSIIADVTADDSNQSLTIWEVIALVTMILVRKSHGNFQNHPVHPVSESILLAAKILTDSRCVV